MQRLSLKQILIIISLSLLLLFSSFAWVSPSYASIRQQEEKPGQILYQSRHSIRDNQGHTWQVILFKRVKDGEVKQVDLRLSGYPDQTIFLHPADLEITHGDRPQLLAPDQFAAEAPAPNVGQFDLSEILPQLPTNGTVKLNLPLNNPVTIKIPIAVLLEWQLIM
ncbi:hypothetical protein Lepto7376_1350 [[Leptolyngbya] sp. PCC 7376]|uniref:DUF3122 domain-containing protein n=1 Tax=[Leptolyngbya] sp. PCC 7376 TaxID=111781 RepID=UPI00029F0A2F|nr:DUF3122 domain-containing protein [[Leptolyngbya] sp. PCC 7376]AFY37702.1 hypothetical protein Lepto7376_1350 [[Leptolyngbya] sp. PCC 7376]